MGGLVAGLGFAVALLFFQPRIHVLLPLGIFALLTAVNVVMVWQSSHRRIDRWLIPVALLDTALILILLYYTGGIASPLVLLLLFPIGQVAIGISSRSAYLVAVVSALGYSELVLQPFGQLNSQASLATLQSLSVFNVLVSNVCFIAFALAAGQTGEALRQQEGRMLNRSTRLRREVRTLARLARTTARETDLPFILRDVLETAAIELELDGAAVLGQMNAESELAVLAHRGFNSNPEVLNTLPSSPLVAEVMRRQRVLTAIPDPRRARGDGRAEAPRSPGVAAAPLLVGDACIGCLYVDAGSQSLRWSDESTLLLEAFADLTAVSLDNTRLVNGLLAEKSKLEATMGAVTDALLIYEPSGRVLLANPSFRELFDVSPHASDLTIAGLETFVSERERLGIGTTKAFEGDLFDPSPSELTVGMPPRFLQRRGMEVTDAAGHVLGAVLTFHDVTEEQQAERLRDEILSTVSHELRTPLTAIKGFVQIFDRRQQRGAVVASPQELQVVMQSVDRLTSLVDDLLDVSRLPGRHVLLERSEVNLTDLASSRIAQVEHDSGRPITLDVKATRVIGAWDAKKLAAVLDNLLTNAVKYSEPGSLVRVEVTNRPGVVQLLVRDSGVGVAPEHLDHVFDAFFRVDNTTTRRTSGLGIGLYLSKRIIDEHRGQMIVRSELGVGSEFGFSLPLSRISNTRPSSHTIEEPARPAPSNSAASTR